MVAWSCDFGSMNRQREDTRRIDLLRNALRVLADETADSYFYEWADGKISVEINVLDLSRLDALINQNAQGTHDINSKGCDSGG